MGDILFTGPRNIFTNYSQVENHFTNGLFSILELSQCEDPSFAPRFFADLLKVGFPQGIESFKVLREMNPKSQGKRRDNPAIMVDAQVTGGDVSLFFETKIKSYTLDRDQIERHIAAVRQCQSKVKKLVVLTPDDECSDFLKELIGPIELGPQFIIHLRWSDVRKYLDCKRKSATWKDRMLGRLIVEFVDVINETIEEQDYIGIIQKVAFNSKTGLLCGKDCLDQLRNYDEGWGLPKKRHELDGEHRKLLIYSSVPRAVFCEAEVGGCKEDRQEASFPWRYQIKPGSVVEFVPPIPLARIEELPNFKNFGKRRIAYSNLLRREYQKLTEGVTKRPVP